MHNNLRFVPLAAAATLLAPAALGATEPVPARPNIIVILADDLGYGDLSCQYAGDIRTPNIDALFTGGVRLDNFYAASNVSSPSRAALLTGRYADMAGVPGVIRTEAAASWGYFEPGTVTLPQALKQVGYNTALIGKWHLGLESPNLPQERGFEVFKGFLGDMMDDYYSHLRHGNNYMRVGTDIVSPEGHATDIFTDWAIDYINGRQAEKPFFLYLAYNAPHAPVQPPSGWQTKVLAREKDITPKRAALVALIEHMDHNVGRVIEALEANGQLENTLIVFTSDNGGDSGCEANNGPQRGAKGEMFEGGIKVPCAVYWKSRLTPRRCDVPMALYDIFPTLCSVTGAPADPHMNGISMVGVFREYETYLPDRLFYWVRREGWNMGGATQNAVRQGRYKLVSHPYCPMLLFDVEADPREQIPLPLKGEVYENLHRMLTERIRMAGAVPWQKK